MTLIVMLALLQVPEFEPIEKAGVAVDLATEFVPSRAGKFLLAIDARSMSVREAGTVQELKKFDGVFAATAFDEKDETLSVVSGDELIQFDVKDWKESRRLKLENAGCALSRQACFSGDRVYYRTLDEGVAFARFNDGKLETEVVDITRRNINELRVRTVLGVSGTTPIVGVQRQDLAICVRGGIYRMSWGEPVIAVAATGGRIAVVRSLGDSVYRGDNFKCIASHEGTSNRAATIDGKKSRVFVRRDDGCYLWSVLAPEAEFKLDSLTDEFSRLCVDAKAGLLYGVVNGKLKSWRIKE